MERTANLIWPGAFLHVKAVLVVLVCAAAARGEGQPPAPGDSQCGLVGGPKAVWIYQYRAGEDPAQRLIRLAYLLADENAPTRFVSPPTIGPIDGEIAAAAVLGQRLHVIFADGTHRLYQPDGATIERDLPLDRVPLALAADEKNDALYAVVPSAVAAALPSDSADTTSQPAQTEPPTPGAALTDSDDGDRLVIQAPDDHEPLLLEPPAPPTPFAVVRFKRGAWQRDRDGPQFLDQPAHCWLAADDGQLHLLFAQPGHGGLVHYTCSTADAWTDPVVVTNLHADQLLAATVSDGVLTIAALPRAGSKSTPSVLRASDGGFSPAGSFQGAAGAVALAPYGSRLALAFAGDDGNPRVGFWPLSGGAVETSPQPVTALVPQVRPWLIEHLALIAYGALVIILVMVFVSRREGLALPASLQPGQIPAPHSRRLLAFLVDVVIFMPVAAVVLGPAVIELTELSARLTPDERMVLARYVTPDFLLRWLVTTVLFATYGSVTECLMAATPGKKMVQCRVVDEMGRPCHWWAIVIRNAIRVVEMFPTFDLMPAIVLILLTRKRQRLGDLVARTMVVQQNPPPPAEEQPDSSDSPAG